MLQKRPKVKSSRSNSKSTMEISKRKALKKDRKRAKARTSEEIGTDDHRVSKKRREKDKERERERTDKEKYRESSDSAARKSRERKSKTSRTQKE